MVDTEYQYATYLKHLKDSMHIDCDDAVMPDVCKAVQGGILDFEFNALNRHIPCSEEEEMLEELESSDIDSEVFQAERQMRDMEFPGFAGTVSDDMNIDDDMEAIREMDRHLEDRQERLHKPRYIVENEMEDMEDEEDVISNDDYFASDTETSDGLSAFDKLLASGILMASDVVAAIPEKVKTVVQGMTCEAEEEIDID